MRHVMGYARAKPLRHGTCCFIHARCSELVFGSVDRSRLGSPVKRVLSVFGTRPEAIKMAPLVHALKVNPGYEPRVCVSAQHRQMLDQVLKLFGIVPDFDLNLMREGADPARVVLTGNTVIDALLQVVERLRSDETLRRRVAARFPFLDDDRRMILVTGHRRENFGEKFVSFCRALRHIATERPDIRIVYAVHFNPNVQQPVRSILNSLANVSLIEPQEYLAFVYLMMRAYLIITDSA